MSVRVVSLAAFAACATVFDSRAAAQGIPPVPTPPGAPVTAERALLGKILFWDEQLSEDNTLACGTCHRPEAGGGDPRAALAAGVHPGADGAFGGSDDGRGSPTHVACASGGALQPDGVFFPAPAVTRRKAPAAIGPAWDPSLFWDGRAAGVFVDSGGQTVFASDAAFESQAAEVVTSLEMSCFGRTWPEVTQKLAGARPLRLATDVPADVQAAVAAHPDYPALFAWAFGDAAITRERAAAAIGAYERTLIPDQTPYDAWFAGQDSALTPAQQSGLSVLVVHYCVFCHTPPLFTDHGFHNLGVRPPAEDLGRAAVTGDLADRGKFKTPSLRNVALRAPYLHNGSQTTLTGVLAFYERGGDFAENRDPLMAPFTLTPQERADALDFLVNGLTDPRCAERLPPFDRPTLRSELAPNPTVAGGGSPGAGGVAPRMIAVTPPFVGADRFTLGVVHALGGAEALLAVSTVAAAPGSMIGPHPLGVALSPAPLLIPASLSASGVASFVASIPDIPALGGLSFHSQWCVGDPAGALGFCVSDVATAVLFAP